ncbi:MAG: 2-isopropylmalate synthase [Cyanobacteria bacterium P01_A01_bin.17]
METIKLRVSDETLRDGVQQVGLFFEDDAKRVLAHLIAQTGVHQIALMPAVHESEAILVRGLAAEGLHHQVVASTMMDRRYIDQAKACGVRQIILFHAVSDRLLCLREPHVQERPIGEEAVCSQALTDRVRSRMLEKVVENLQYATSIGLKISFAAEDASRADFDFLVECINTFQSYIDCFFLCDTVGVLTPEKTYIWVQDLLQCTHQPFLSVHFHNDMGLALENTIQAVYAGAMGISGTFSGIGERAGNVALEQVLHGLRARFGWEVAGIDYEALPKVVDYLTQKGIRANPPYSRQARQFETGIHVNSLIRDRNSYAVFPHAEPDIWFGRCSGASNFRYLFETHLQQSLTQAQYEQLRSAIKALSIERKRSFSTAEVLELLDQGILKVF